MGLRTVRGRVGADGNSGLRVSEALTQRFTGKERDSETGLDYFTARYLASVFGRFTSPDAPLADQHVEDPQSWNLYAYARNSPLKFVDPSGNEIELSGTEEERKRELAALRETVGKKAGKLLYSYDETDRLGNKTGRYLVGIHPARTDTLKREQEFSEINKASAAVGELIGDDRTVTLKEVSQGTEIGNDTLGPVKVVMAGNQEIVGYTTPGLTHPSGDRVFLSRPNPDGTLGTMPGFLMSDGRQAPITPGVNLLHELGHIASIWKLSTSGTAKTSVDYENFARKAHDPNAALRTIHSRERR